MTLPLVYTGKYAGDGTGDPGKTAFDKLNAWISFLQLQINTIAGGGGSGGVVLSYLQTTLTADTANYTAGGTFPLLVGNIDFLLNTQDVNLSGMQAGLFNGQTIWVRNAPSSTFSLILPIENSGSAAANRWSGSTGSLGMIPGDMTPAVYNTTLARWAI